MNSYHPKLGRCRSTCDAHVIQCISFSPLHKFDFLLRLLTLFVTYKFCSMTRVYTGESEISPAASDDLDFFVATPHKFTKDWSRRRFAMLRTKDL